MALIQYKKCVAAFLAVSSLLLYGCDNSSMDNIGKNDIITPESTHVQNPTKEAEAEIRNESPAEDFTYEMVDGEVIITGYVGVDREICIPAEINNRPVTQIGEEAFAEYDMTTVDIPVSVKIIGEAAFRDCDCLIEINIPSGLERIERHAFDSCDALEDVQLPEKLAFLGYGSFANTGIGRLEIPENFTGFDMKRNILSYTTDAYGNKEYVYGDVIIDPLDNCGTVLVVLEDSEALKQLELYGQNEIFYEVVDQNGELVFSNIEETPPDEFEYYSDKVQVSITGYKGQDKVVVIPATIDGLPVTKISKTAFCGKDVTKVYIPKSVTFIGEGAFKDSGLRHVVFHAEAQVTVGKQAFAGCSKLKTLELPKRAYFDKYYNEIFDEELGYFVPVESDEPLWPIAEEDETIIVVYEGSEVYESLAGKYNEGEIQYRVK